MVNENTLLGYKLYDETMGDGEGCTKEIKEEWLFMDLEEAKEECRRRNNEEDYGYHY